MWHETCPLETRKTKRRSICQPDHRDNRVHSRESFPYCFLSEAVGVVAGSFPAVEDLLLDDPWHGRCLGESLGSATVVPGVCEYNVWIFDADGRDGMCVDECSWRRALLCSCRGYVTNVALFTCSGACLTEYTIIYMTWRVLHRGHESYVICCTWREGPIDSIGRCRSNPTFSRSRKL